MCSGSSYFDKAPVPFYRPVPFVRELVTSQTNSLLGLSASLASLCELRLSTTDKPDELP